MSDSGRKRLYEVINQDSVAIEAIKKELSEYVERMLSKVGEFSAAMYIKDIAMFFTETAERYGIEEIDMLTAYTFYVAGREDTLKVLRGESPRVPPDFL